MANPKAGDLDTSSPLSCSTPEQTHHILRRDRLPPSPSPTSSSPLPPSVLRLWRPAAQRNLRNQWSKLASYRENWTSLSSSGRSNATLLVNSFLSQRYMDSMELGVLSEMINIREKACHKLLKQQEMHCTQLLLSYKEMVAIVLHMIQTSGSMRCFSQGATGSPLVQFSSIQVDPNDTGDGGGLHVSYLLFCFSETLFCFDRVQQRLLVVGLLSITFGKIGQVEKLSWSDELYPGEADDLSTGNMYNKETNSPVLPRLKGWSSDTPDLHSNNQPEREVLQVYLTTWLAEVNIDIDRVDEIFTMVGEEMHNGEKTWKCGISRFPSRMLCFCGYKQSPSRASNFS
ncbi:hypothetical protein V2J09_019544 [Rumex salicifolius]